MTRKTVLIDVGFAETRIAFLEDGRLAEVSYERPAPDEDGPAPLRQAGSQLGNIYLGRVKRVLPGVQAAFIDIGQARNGFLSARDAKRLKDYAGQLIADTRPDPPPINELVHEGEALLVQVIKDPIGDKGARLSASVSLPGRLLILVPEQVLFALSRRILDEAERARLQALIEDIAGELDSRHGAKFGFILRTAAIGSGRAELLEDAERLVAQWLSIKTALAGLRPPVLVYRELGAISRVLRDHLNEETDQIVINDAAAFAEAKRYANEVTPALAGRVVLHGRTLFERYGIEAELEGLLMPRVPLPSGGWITIETTEALTAIDVNSGSLEAGCLEETGLRTNLDAAKEIGRQLRLRGIGGLIVIDFIHMGEAANVEAVLEALKATLAMDRAPTQMTGMSLFGLVEVTRKRVREPLSRLLTESCGPCGGQARIPTAGTVAGAALRRLARETDGRRGLAGLRIRVDSAVASWFSARRRTVIEPLQARLGCPVEIEAAPDFARDRFEILPLGAAS